MVPVLLHIMQKAIIYLIFPFKTLVLSVWFLTTTSNRPLTAYDLSQVFSRIHHFPKHVCFRHVILTDLISQLSLCNVIV